MDMYMRAAHRNLIKNTGWPLIYFTSLLFNKYLLHLPSILRFETPFSQLPYQTLCYTVIRHLRTFVVSPKVRNPLTTDFESNCLPPCRPVFFTVAISLKARNRYQITIVPCYLSKWLLSNDLLRSAWAASICSRGLSKGNRIFIFYRTVFSSFTDLPFRYNVRPNLWNFPSCGFRIDFPTDLRTLIWLSLSGAHSPAILTSSYQTDITFPIQFLSKPLWIVCTDDIISWYHRR
jgi:hypothetical protein